MGGPGSARDLVEDLGGLAVALTGDTRAATGLLAEVLARSARGGDGREPDLRTLLVSRWLHQVRRARPGPSSPGPSRPGPSHPPTAPPGQDAGAGRAADALRATTARSTVCRRSSALCWCCGTGSS